MSSESPCDNRKQKFVLDTNVLLHDPTSLYRFHEHDIFLPLVVLEELDNHKKGVADIARNARQVARTLDILLGHGSLGTGFSLEAASGGQATGRLYFVKASAVKELNEVAGLESAKPDNQILACVRELRAQPGDVVLVTKDINLRVKALALGLPAQDYRSDRVLLGDEDMLPTGFRHIDATFWVTYSDPDRPTCKINGKHHHRLTLQLPVNSFLAEQITPARTRIWKVVGHEGSGSLLRALPGNLLRYPPLVTAQNVEQKMALHLLRDDNVDFVALLGKAGSGKTLLALAAGLEQVKYNRFQSVLITRATVPLGNEIGFLPGTEEEKMDAWLGGTLRDAYTVLGLEGESSPLSAKVEVASLSFMRGRSFQGKYIIIDEAQNLTATQVRALLTRAGEGSKVVLTGNLGQIDTPFLDEGSSGLTWAVSCLQDWEHSGHIILPRGVRSRLATRIEELADGALSQA